MYLIDFIFPRKCLGCGKMGKYLCRECILKEKTVKTICPICKRSSIDGFTHSNCIRKYSLNGLTTIWKYNGVIKRAISATKYKYATEVGHELSNYIDFALSDKTFLFKEYDHLIPTPLYWYRENNRGFNQAQLFSENISKKLNLTIEKNILIKTGSNRAQVGLNAKERKENIKNTFKVVSPGFVKGKKILLFDDVYTTGSTLKEIAEVLKKSGASKVWAITVAR